MRTLEGIRYLINLDSAEIQQNFAGGVAPPDIADTLVVRRTYLHVLVTGERQPQQADVTGQVLGLGGGDSPHGDLPRRAVGDDKGFHPAPVAAHAEDEGYGDAKDGRQDNR